jgi:urea transporter
MSRDSAPRLLGESVLRGYASLLFLDGVAAGLAVFAVTLFRPEAAIGGLVAALSATLLALAFGYPREIIRSGIYCVSPILTGLGIGAFRGVSGRSVIFIIVTAWFTFLLATLLNDRLARRFRSSSLSLSFAFVVTILLIVLPPGTTASSAPGLNAVPGETSWPEIFFASIGSILFIPSALPGLLLFFVILVKSRALAVLSILGFVSGSLFYRALGGPVEGITAGMAGMNFLLTTMAVGGVCLHAGPHATAHAIGATAVAALLAIVSGSALSLWGLPVFSWPFNLAVIAWMSALGLRDGTRAPLLTWGLSGAPEEMFAQKRLVARATAEYFAPVLPVIGEWTVTQSVGGRPTHQPPWQNAWDFEVMDAEGFPFRREALRSAAESAIRLEDYLSFGAPVVAVADGVVAHAVDGVLDNRPGESNTRDNFGNYVMIRHSGDLHSVCAHLLYGSVRVRIGDPVRAGQVIGLCGSSGRSPRPHLHFHVQAGAAPGAPTIPVLFREYVARRGPGLAAVFVDRGSPAHFERVTPLLSVEDARPGPRVAPGHGWRWRVTRGAAAHEETWQIDIDLWGGVRVVADDPAALAVWKVDGRGMTGTWFEGSRRGALHAFFAGHTRVPSRVTTRFPWEDEPGLAHAGPGAARLLHGFLLPFLAPAGAISSFRVAHADASGTEISARSGAREVLSEWDESGAPVRITVRELGRERLVAERVN